MARRTKPVTGTNSGSGTGSSIDETITLESNGSESGIGDCKAGAGLKSTVEPLECKTSVTVEKELLVVIPYLKSGAQNNELELAVAGWKKHFKESFRIVVIGDNEPFMDGDDQIIYIPHTCSTNNPPLDIVAKMMLVMSHAPEYDGMIWSNDDIFAINDFDISDIKTLKCIGSPLAGDLSSANPFQRNMVKTATLLRSEKLPIRNFSCHLPVYYDFEKLLSLIEKHELEKESYLISSLYFNTFYPNRIPLKLDIGYDNLKCGIYRQNPNMEIVRAAFETKIWMNNSPQGYLPEVYHMLANHYR